MEYFPAFLRLDARRCLLVGGGEIAARKARLLLDAGARLTVVAPALGDAFAGLPRREAITHVARRFDDADVEGHWLVVSATGEPETERRVYAAASRARIFVNGVDDQAHSSYITPAIVDRSPLVIAVSSGGAAPVLARRIRARIETMLPSRLGRLAGLAGLWRARVRERLETLGQRLAFWERVFDGPIANAVLEGDEGRAESAMQSLLEAVAAGGEKPAGEAWLVGAGPGDPDLLTLRAFRMLQAADVILHDRLVSDDVLALARRDAERIPVGKSPGCKGHTQEEINALLVSLVGEGKRVLRLKGGDPYVFGRGGEEAQALARAGLPCIVVPGITAAAGCAASAGIPLTHRDLAQSVVLLTAHGSDSIDRLDWASLARDRQTLAVYMGVGRFAELSANLVAHGRAADTPVAIIERGTTPEQRIIRGTLGQLGLLARAHRVEAPAMLFIGEVARLATASTPADGDRAAVATAVAGRDRAAQIS